MKQAKTLGRFSVGGWVVVRMLLPAEAQYGVLVGTDSVRGKLGTFALWVRGRIEGVNHRTGEAYLRVPGTFRGHDEAMPAGRYTLTAVEDTEWWCVDKQANAGMQPSEVTPLRLAPDGAYAVPRGSYLLLCDEQGRVFSGGSVVSVEAEVFGLLFKEEKPK